MRTRPTKAAAFLAASAALAACASAASAGAPPGATARCSDGTYSFSQHRSGTCSHHGGVAAWLARGTAPVATVVTSRTVVLTSRTRTAGCRVGARPDRRCSPGAYDAGLTKAVVCSPSFHTSSVRNVTELEKHAVEREYGLAARRYGSTLEIDHVIPLELGGSNDIANLFPEGASFADGDPGFRAKDRLENRLHARVCSGAMSLSAARRGIATDWVALYTAAFR